MLSIIVTIGTSHSTDQLLSVNFVSMIGELRKMEPVDNVLEMVLTGQDVLHVNSMIQITLSAVNNAWVTEKFILMTLMVMLIVTTSTFLIAQTMMKMATVTSVKTDGTLMMIQMLVEAATSTAVSSALNHLMVTLQHAITVWTTGHLLLTTMVTITIQEMSVEENEECSDVIVRAQMKKTHVMSVLMDSI